MPALICFFFLRVFTNQPLANHSRVETVSRTDRPGGRFESSKRGKDEPKGKSDGKVHAAGFAFNVLVDSKFPSQLVQTGSFERDGVAQKSLEIFGSFWIIDAKITILSQILKNSSVMLPQ